VVDNGSSDETAQAVDEYRGPLPLARTYEPTAGLSHARNRGVQDASGDWLIWIDDDVIVAPTWLEAYYHAARQHRHAAILGGVIAPSLVGTPPAWLVRGIEHVNDAFAARSPEIANGSIAQHTLPYGANFAITRNAARRFPFDVTLGRHPDQPLRGGEELAVMQQILSEGGTGQWVPTAMVQHCIDPARQTEQYLTAYYLEAGRATAEKWSQHPPGVRIRRCVESSLRWLAHRTEYAIHAGNPSRARRAWNLREAAWHAGYVRGCITKPAVGHHGVSA